MRTMTLIPAYNEEHMIESLVKKTLQYVDQVVVCDDGSLDNTSELAKKAGALVLKHTENSGKGAALKTLFEFAKNSEYDAFITIDGDGQFLPDEIPLLLSKLQKTKSDIVIGNRFSKKNKIPKYRKIGNKILDKVTNAASNSSISDSQSGFRAYSKKAIEAIDITSTGFSVDSEILVSAITKNLKINSVDITVIYDTGGKTSTKNPISHVGDVLGPLLETIAIKHPIIILGIPGLTLFIFGIIFAILTILYFNETRIFSVPSTLVSMGSLLFGLMLLLVSVILYSIGRAVEKRLDPRV